jgi:hypothetical protein
MACWNSVKSSCQYGSWTQVVKANAGMMIRAATIETSRFHLRLSMLSATIQTKPIKMPMD